MDDPHTIYKDLDLQSTFQLEKGWQERLEYQVKADCALLETCQVCLIIAYLHIMFGCACDRQTD